MREKIVEKKEFDVCEQKNSLTGNRTPAACVTGRNTDHYTIKDGWPESLEEPYLGLYTVVTALLTTHPAN